MIFKYCCIVSRVISCEYHFQDEKRPNRVTYHLNQFGSHSTSDVKDNLQHNIETRSSDDSIEQQLSSIIKKIEGQIFWMFTTLIKEAHVLDRHACDVIYALLMLFLTSITIQGRSLLARNLLRHFCILLQFRQCAYYKEQHQQPGLINTSRKILNQKLIKSPQSTCQCGVFAAFSTSIHSTLTVKQTDCLVLQLLSYCRQKLY
ncbi:unnamed protein product [Paramecium octaurelia]|uniref:Uncharacterized protein n=1 Tax=Paramecium octaurelia TaxID=43137 RepID=A0A8S1TXY2_PAROT|nr:unnamed protein product [Paramecium octaurelia]